MDKLYSISKTSAILDITPKTLRIWDKEGKLKPVLTSGGHRRYKESDIKKITGETEKESSVKECATYARVFSLKQKTSGDLDRQSQRLSEYCAKQGILVTHIIKDVGSGLNDKRAGFTKLTDMIIQGKISLVVIEHKDRLTRFQFNFIEKMFKSYGCDIIAVDDSKEVSDGEELTRDIMALLASFSGRYYGKRSLKRRKNDDK